MEQYLIKMAICLMLFVSINETPWGDAAEQDPESVEEWFEMLPHAKQKLTKLHFYLQDVRSGQNPTVVQVAQSNTSATSPTSFGTVVVVDDPMTVGPDPNSKVIGRAQALNSLASQEERALVMSLQFVFTAGKYNGSTLSVLGRNPTLRKYREVPVVGGTGVFRLARGIATIRTYSLNTTSRNAVIEFNVALLHYSFLSE